MEAIEVKMARLEEGLVRVHDKIDMTNKLHSVMAQDTKHIRDKIDMLTENHWKLYAKVAGLAAVISLAIKFIK